MLLIPKRGVNYESEILGELSKLAVSKSSPHSLAFCQFVEYAHGNQEQ
jgi:hypothetical protein